MKIKTKLFLLICTFPLVGCSSNPTPSSTSSTSSQTSIPTSESTTSPTSSSITSEITSQVTSSSETPTSTSSSTSQDLRPDYERGELKDVNGEGLMFFETVGYSTKDASIFEEEGVRYITYVDNETRNGERVFAARKGELVNNKWVYGERHVVFRASGKDDAWDQYIYQPSVVKGIFVKGETTYKYLLTYHANDTGEDRNNSIGFAVSNNVLGEWQRIGEEPLIANPEIYESCYGLGSPTMISYNHGGLVILSYSFGEDVLSGERCKFVDFSDLDNIVVETGYANISNKGLLYRDDGVISNAGIALKGNAEIVMINDNMPDAVAPGCSTSMELAEASVDIINDASLSWNSLKKISGFDTMGDSTLGWDELYSGCFVTDPYGKLIINDGVIEICYSTYNVEAQNPSQTAQLCIFEYTYEE